MTFEPTPPSTPAAPEPFAPAAPEPSAVPTNPVVGPTTGSAQPPAPLNAQRKRSGGSWLNVVLVIAAAVAIGGVAFAVGRSTAPASAATGAGLGNFGGARIPIGSFAPGANGPGFRGGIGGGLTVSGTVESIDGDTLTIRTASGATIEVATDASTTYHTQAPASADDVDAGSTVQIQLETGTTGALRPDASAAPTGPIGTAGSVTVVP